MLNDTQMAQACAAMSTVRKSAPLLLQRLQKEISVPPVELIYTPHSRWPLPHSQTIQQHRSRSLRISVLDSSFNPPTLAHLALANSPRPSYRDDEKNSESQDTCGYDAKLFLLSVKNADKSLKAGDATYQQRLEMMLLLSKDVIASQHDSEAANVAIAIIDKPTFVGKSSALLDFLQRRLTTPLPLELTFLVGLDTLERLFSPRYYTSETDMMASLRQFLSAAPQGDNSRIVCAKRVSSPAEAAQSIENPEDISSLALFKEFRESDRIVNIDIGNIVNRYSSSAIRSAVGRFGLGQTVDQDGAWKSMVTREIADYIVEQRLYVD